MKEGHLFTEGIIKADYLDTMRKQIQSLPPDAEVIIHHIKSPGGNVYAAWKTIPELMKIGKPIKSMIEGEASSIASWIAVAPAFEVEAVDPSTAMIHEPFFPDGIQGSLGVDELEEAKVELSQIRQSMAEAYAKKSGKTADEWLTIMKKNTRMTANMLKAHGLVDKITPIEPRRIAAEFMEEVKEDLKNLKEEIMSIFRKAQPAAVAAIDLALKGGGVLNVQSEDGDFVNKPATKDGKPAEGSYPLEDGRELVCVGGVVKEVKTAPAAPQETAEQKLQKLQAQIDSMKAAEETKRLAAEAETKAKAEQADKEKIAAELKEKETKIAAMAQEMEELKKRTAGNDNAPSRGTGPVAEYEYPVAYGKTSEEKLSIRASRTFMFEHMPWIEMEPKFRKKYPGGKFSDGTKFSDYRNGGPEAVSILETNFTYTWQGELTLDLFFRPSLSSPSLNTIFTVDVGSKDKKRYNIVPTLSKILKPYTGCDQAVTGTSLDITDKYMQLKAFRMKEKWCQDDFTNKLTGTFNHLAQAWLKDGNDGFDPAGTPIDRIIMEALKDSLRRDVFRRVMLGDSDSSSADWNQINGLITTLIDQSGASNYCVYREGAALGIGTLAANTASARFEAMYNNSNILLKEHVIDSGKGYLLTTRSMWENYYSTLVGVGAVTEQAYSDYRNGTKNLEFRGIPVIPMGILDSFLADSTCPLSATTRHIAILSSTDNHILGVENTGDLGKIKSWFSDDDNVRYYSSQMTLGVLAPLHCDLTTIAY